MTNAHNEQMQNRDNRNSDQAGYYPRPLAIVTGASTGIGYELAGEIWQTSISLLI